MSGFQKAWNAYLCAMYGHVFTWTSNRSYRLDEPPPKGCMCSRCGAVKK